MSDAIRDVIAYIMVSDFMCSSENIQAISDRLVHIVKSQVIGNCDADAFYIGETPCRFPRRTGRWSSNTGRTTKEMHRRVAYPTPLGRLLRQTVASGSYMYACHSGLRDYEEKRCDALRDKRTRRKAIQLPSDIDTFVCRVCG